jgi:hypothetical protein
MSAGVAARTQAAPATSASVEITIRNTAVAPPAVADLAASDLPATAAAAEAARKTRDHETGIARNQPVVTAGPVVTTTATSGDQTRRSCAR